MAKAKAAPQDQAPQDEQVDEQHPTIEEAKAMFDENPGLASVLTTEGWLHRDGSLT